jgi:hypothetical protein
MVERVVLDAAGVDDLAAQPKLRALLRRSAERGGEVWCAAVTIAEVARGPQRTARARSALAHRHGGQRIRVQATDERFALLVGALLHEAGVGSEALADAHAVGCCAPAGVALVVTSDPSDIAHLASGLPGVRVQCVRPDLAS